MYVLFRQVKIIFSYGAEDVQVEGGFIQGVGWLTSEELCWNDAGELTTHAPSTYKIPTCSDLPPDFRVSLLQNARNVEDTIYRSKAVGEQCQQPSRAGSRSADGQRAAPSQDTRPAVPADRDRCVPLQ